MKREFHIFWAMATLVLVAACMITAGPGGPQDRDRGADAGEHETQRIANVLAANEWGQVLRCRLDEGKVRFINGFNAYAAADFTIVAGERQELDLFSASGGNRETLWLSFRADGSDLVACPHRFRDHGPSCDLFQTRFDRHEPAIADALDVPHFIEGAHLTCRWPAWRRGGRESKTYPLPPVPSAIKHIQ